jgi:DNA anti-recombination protein RmuC
VAEETPTTGQWLRTDRELLLSVKQDLRYLKSEVQDSKTEIRSEIQAMVKDQKEMASDHERRIRDLERFHWWVIGAVAGSSALTGLITKFFH